ncbi:exported protein of unknown function [Nitrosotalea devaniterrae]|uniref:Uncharacterized protein n=1 Tax=Nitrosotalea devaniterrae TaxID=1078905 RepID=A0A128A5K9_9ARCH|nr:exported protein of unknown function [Candidatus Nitrosotalea devanaterra]
MKNYMSHNKKMVKGIIIGLCMLVLIIIGVFVNSYLLVDNKGNTVAPQNDILSVNSCDGFHPVPNNLNDNMAIPVLIMSPDSMGCARLNFTVIYDYNDTTYGVRWPRIAELNPLFYIGGYHPLTNNDSLNVTENNAASLFQTQVIPNTIDLANMKIGSNFTVIYIIKPLKNATGFYDYSLLKPNCERYPLAVVYDINTVNASDFSASIKGPTPPCVSPPYKLSTVEVSGIGYKELK